MYKAVSPLAGKNWSEKNQAEKNPALKLEHVSHHYQKTLALDDVSLTLPSGITVGLIGPDGVGKSTLLSLIAGVKIIQQGSVIGFRLKSHLCRKVWGKIFIPRYR